MISLNILRTEIAPFRSPYRIQNGAYSEKKNLKISQNLKMKNVLKTF